MDSSSAKPKLPRAIFPGSEPSARRPDCQFWVRRAQLQDTFPAAFQLQEKACWGICAIHPRKACGYTIIISIFSENTECRARFELVIRRTSRFKPQWSSVRRYRVRSSKHRCKQKHKQLARQPVHQQRHRNGVSNC